MELNKIYNENCLETMARMPDKSCDVFTDPPYNVGMDYGEGVNDKMSDPDYILFITEVLNECKRVANVFVCYVPKKWNLLYWNILGPDYQEIILPNRILNSFYHGFVNRYNKLLTNAKPEKIKQISNVWENMAMPGTGYYFREETYSHPGYTSLAITTRAIMQLTKSDIIYDPFSGTGTTAIAAIKCNRDFIGSELNSNWISIADKRIKAEQQKLTLFI